MRSFSLCVVLAALAAVSVEANPNGLGRTPPMGWNTWCTLSSCFQPQGYSHSFHDVCNVWMVKSVAEAMIENGMQAAGYNYVNLDDCWEAGHRADDGSLLADPERFPEGIAELASWLHERNFKFGLYLSAGWTTCSTGGRNITDVPGSIGHYLQDAETVASWGTDYVKLDWCGTTNSKAPPYILDQQNATTGFTTAANKTGHAMWMNFHCGHEPGNIPDWCPQDGNSWRMGTDHHDNWPNSLQIINNLKDLAQFGRPYRWNDPDFVMVGGAGCDKNVTGLRCPGQTNTEYVTEFSLWAMAAAPLLVATDVRNWTPFMKSVLLNTEVIAIDQDSLGIAGGMVASWGCDAPSDTCQVWARPLSTGSYAAAMFNANNQTHGITTEWSVIPGAGWDSTTKVNVRDVWQHKDLGTFTGSYSAQVEAHGTVMLVLTAA